EAGAAATWLAGILDQGHGPLEAEARRVPPGSGGVVFLPFLDGQIAPERRPAVRAAYLGMAAETGRADLYRATMEGVAYLYRSIAHRLEELGLCRPGDEWRGRGGGGPPPPPGGGTAPPPPPAPPPRPPAGGRPRP